MRRKIALFLSAAILISANSCEAQRPDNVLRLVSYNVGAFHKADFCTEHLCEEILKELNPDAISLNELDSCNRRSGIYTDQLAQVAAQLGNWPYQFGSAIAYKGGSYGVGVLTHPHHRVVDKWSARLPKADGKEVRALAVIETEKFVFCSTHLDLTDSSQIVQIEAIDSLIANRYYDIDKAVFLCGDMNAEPQSATIRKLLESWEPLSSMANTFSTDNPRKCIDYIFSYRHAKAVKLREQKVCTMFKDEALDAVLASDHFPTFVEVEY